MKHNDDILPANKEPNTFYHVAKITLISIWWFWLIIFGSAAFLLVFSDRSTGLKTSLVAASMYLGAVLVAKRQRKKQLNLD